MSIPDPDRPLSRTEAAVKLGVSEQTVTKLMKEGHLPAISIPGHHKRDDPNDVKRLQMSRRNK